MPKKIVMAQVSTKFFKQVARETEDLGVKLTEQAVAPARFMKQATSWKLAQAPFVYAAPTIIHLSDSN